MVLAVRMTFTSPFIFFLVKPQKKTKKQVERTFENRDIEAAEEAYDSTVVRVSGWAGTEAVTIMDNAEDEADE